MEPAEASARLLAVDGRGACTDAERRAAAWLEDDLYERGHDPWVEPYWVRPHWAVPVALGSLLAGGASLLALTLPLAAAIVAAVAAVGLAIEALGYEGPLRRVMPRRATQDVVVRPAADPDRVELLICARYDAPRRGLVLNDGWRRLAVPLRNVRAWLAGAAAVVTGCAVARWQGVDAGWLGAIQLLPTVALIAALAASLDIGLSAFSPGADSASAAAVALAVHDELTREAPAELAPGLLLRGAGGSSARTLRAHLRETRPDRRRTVILELGPCAGGSPRWAAGHRQLKAAAERAAAALELETGRPRPHRVRGARRLPSIRIACLDHRGLAPRAHQGDDDTVDPAALAAALDLALGIADALDADIAARATAVA
jgi:hypothetical protein